MTNDERWILLTYLCSLTYGRPVDTSPADVAMHFRKCPGCGVWIDLRRPGEVLEHQEPGHTAERLH